jgi:putative ABC transport system ATP-binding protein
MPIIKLQDVSKLFGFGDAATVALDEVSLSIEPGEFVAIMGPSGSGKTTLMNVIGLLDRPTHGEFLLDGRDVTGHRPWRQAKIRRDTIGFVFQSFHLLPRLTVLENVALPLAYKGMPKIRRLKHAAKMLERVGLADREYFLPRHLSGGQAQRVAIARALINDPTIIIADEPTGNLDSASSRLVMELLSDIHKAGNTVILVTHNPALTRYASRVVFMQDGLIVADELSAVGEMPASLRRSMYFMPKKTVKDDLEGVSALMQAMPDTEPTPKPPAKKKAKAPKKVKTYKARATKKGKK